MNDVELSIQQFSQAWQTMSAGSPDYTREVSEGVEYIFTGLPIAFFNVALLTGRGVSADALASQGQRACAWASGRNVPWLFVVTHDALEPGVDAAAALDGCGLAPMMPLTGMVAQRISPASRVPRRPRTDSAGRRRRVLGAARRELARLRDGPRRRARP